MCPFLLAASTPSLPSSLTLWLQKNKIMGKVLSSYRLRVNQLQLYFKSLVLAPAGHGHQEITRDKTGETDNIHGLRFWSPFYHTICAIQFVPLTPRRPGLIGLIRPLHLLHARCALAEALSNRARRSRLTPQGTETSRCAVGSDLAAFERGVLASQPLIASRAAVCF